MRWIGVCFLIFSSSCYSVDWGHCKLNSYFYGNSIEEIEVFFHSAHQLSIDFEKSGTYWGVSLHKINKESSNELLKSNNMHSNELSTEKLVYENYVRLLRQDLFHIIKKTKKFSIPTTPTISGYSIDAMLDPKNFEKSELRNFSIAVQEYDDFIVFTKIVITGEGELPSVSDIKDIVLQFRKSCSINNT
jgi:hypothetical protein